jgi:RHS repeat-associated protein
MVLRDRDTDNNGSLDERLYVQQDANGNVTALVNIAGAVVERSVEDPYGQRSVWTPNWQSRPVSLFDWKYYHQGLRLDATGTLYDNRARMYSPTLMRFLQNDPLGFGAGDPNTYRYEGNGPTGGLDPGGKQVIVGGTGTSSVIPSATVSSRFIEEGIARRDANDFRFFQMRTALLHEQQDYYWKETLFRGSTFLKWVGAEMEIFTGCATTIATAGWAGPTFAGVGFDDLVSATRSWNEGRPIDSIRNNLVTKVTGSSTAGVAADILAPIAAGAWATRAAQSFTFESVGPRSTILRNAPNGRAFEEQGLNALQGEFNNVVGQVSIRPFTESGDLAVFRVRLDALGTDTGGGTNLFDFKSSATAGFTPNQRLGYPLLEQFGGQVVGGNGGVFYPAGTPIPPTPVTIIRP